MNVEHLVSPSVGGYWKRKKAVCTCYAQEKVCDIENMIYRSANGITMRKPIPIMLHLPVIMGMMRLRLQLCIQ